MAYTMIEKFQKYGGWQTKVIKTCQKFYESFNIYPNFIRMTENTLDKLFDECEAAFNDPDSQEHIVRDSNGVELIQIRDNDDEELDDEQSPFYYDESYFDDDDSWLICPTSGNMVFTPQQGTPFETVTK